MGLRQRIATWVLAHRRAGLVLFVAITAFFAAGLPRVDLRTVFSDLLPGDDPFVQTFLDHPNFGNPLTVTLGVANVSFVAQGVDWMPEQLYDIVRKAFHHRGFSFIRIIQRCPEWLPQAQDPWMHDPSKVQVLHHADGLQPSAGTLKLYRNQVDHDPINIDRARERAGALRDELGGLDQYAVLTLHRPANGPLHVLWKGYPNWARISARCAIENDSIAPNA